MYNVGIYFLWFTFMYIVRLPFMFTYFHLLLRNRRIALLIAFLVFRYGVCSFIFCFLLILFIYLVYSSVMSHYWRNPLVLNSRFAQVNPSGFTLYAFVPSIYLLMFSTCVVNLFSYYRWCCNRLPQSWTLRGSPIYPC